jgi:hypothetical protein
MCLFTNDKTHLPGPQEVRFVRCCPNQFPKAQKSIYCAPYPHIAQGQLGKRWVSLIWPQDGGCKYNHVIQKSYRKTFCMQINVQCTKVHVRVSQ